MGCWHCYLSGVRCRLAVLLYRISFHRYWQLMPLPLKKTEWWGAGVVICLQRGANLHMAQLMPQPLTVSCFSKIQIGFTFLVPANPGGPGQRAVKRACVCVENNTTLFHCYCHQCLQDVQRQKSASARCTVVIKGILILTESITVITSSGCMSIFQMNLRRV